MPEPEENMVENLIGDAFKSVQRDLVDHLSASIKVEVAKNIKEFAASWLSGRDGVATPSDTRTVPEGNENSYGSRTILRTGLVAGLAGTAAGYAYGQSTTSGLGDQTNQKNSSARSQNTNPLAHAYNSFMDNWVRPTLNTFTGASQRDHASATMAIGKTYRTNTATRGWSRHRHEAVVVGNVGKGLGAVTVSERGSLTRDDAKIGAAVDIRQLAAKNLRAAEADLGGKLEGIFKLAIDSADKTRNQNKTFSSILNDVIKHDLSSEGIKIDANTRQVLHDVDIKAKTPEEFMAKLERIGNAVVREQPIKLTAGNMNTSENYVTNHDVRGFGSDNVGVLANAQKDGTVRVKMTYDALVRKDESARSYLSEVAKSFERLDQVNTNKLEPRSRTTRGL